MERLNPYPVTEEAKLVVKTLLEAEPESFDVTRELDRLTTYACPECGSHSTTQPDEEGLLDCMDCGIWFDPKHPRNRHALHGATEGSLCQGCGKPITIQTRNMGVNPENPDDVRFLCGNCWSHANSSRQFWNRHARGHVGEAAEPDPHKPDELLGYAMKHGLPPRIKISFAVITPESAEQGDYAETGWDDEEGISFELDEYEKESGKTLPDIVSSFLKSNGATEASSSAFHRGVWYTSREEGIDGSTTERSYHLEGFRAQDEERIFQMITARNY
jgi:hypothetical protein